MNAKRIIRLLYVALSVIALLMTGSTTATIFQVIPGILFMWFMYLLYSLGFNETHRIILKKGPNRELRFPWIDAILKHKLLLLSLCFVFSIAITYFYTGRTPFTLLKALLNNESLYSSYQTYFAANDLGTFSIRKVPNILMNYLLNFIVVLMFINNIVFLPKIRRRDVSYLVLISIPYLSYGLARGTNFELFLIVFLTFYCLLLRSHYHGFKTSVSFKTKLIIIFLAVIVYFIFESVVIVRYNNFGFAISRDIRYDSTEWISYISPDMALMITRISQYFAFGLFYTTAFFQYVMLGSLGKFITFLFPFASVLLNSSVSVMVNQHIDQSTNWVPDIVTWFGRYGLILTSIIIFFIGSICAMCSKKKDIVHIALLYFLILQMFSLPIGNFVVVLSANKLIVLTLILILMWKKSHLKKGGGFR